MTTPLQPGPSDFRTFPAWRQARHLALAIAAVSDGFPQTGPAQQWVRKIEQGYLTMLIQIVAAFERRGSAREARESIDRIETVLQQTFKKKLLARQDLARLTKELDVVRTLFAGEGSAGAVDSGNPPSNSHTFIPISIGVSHD